MSSLYLQYDNLPTSILTYFYYFQFKIASFFHVTDVSLEKSLDPLATSFRNRIDDRFDCRLLTSRSAYRWYLLCRKISLP